MYILHHFRDIRPIDYLLKFKQVTFHRGCSYVRPMSTDLTVPAFVRVHSNLIRLSRVDEHTNRYSRSLCQQHSALVSRSTTVVTEATAIRRVGGLNLPLQGHLQIPHKSEENFWAASSHRKILMNTGEEIGWEVSKMTHCVEWNIHR